MSNDVVTGNWETVESPVCFHVSEYQLWDVEYPCIMHDIDSIKNPTA